MSLSPRLKKRKLDQRGHFETTKAEQSNSHTDEDLGSSSSGRPDSQYFDRANNHFLGPTHAALHPDSNTIPNPNIRYT